MAPKSAFVHLLCLAEPTLQQLKQMFTLGCFYERFFSFADGSLALVILDLPCFSLYQLSKIACACSLETLRSCCESTSRSSCVNRVVTSTDP